jgi:PAS domain S-box-containing protein
MRQEINAMAEELKRGTTGQDCSNASLFDRLMEIRPVGILVMERDGHISCCNAEAERLLRFGDIQASRRSFNLLEWQLADREGRLLPAERGPFHRVFSTGRPVRDEYWAGQETNGRKRLLSINASPAVDETGRAARVVARLEDVTDRFEAENMLRKSEENFRSIFANAPCGIFQSTANRLISANPVLARMFGYGSPEEMVASSGDAATFSVHPEQRAEAVRAAIASGTYVQREIEYRRKDGATFYGSLRMRAVCDEAGELRLLEGFVEDMTERKSLENKVAMREQHLISFFKNATAGLCILDADLRILKINETLARINGLPASEHLGKTVREVLPKLASVLEPILRRVTETGEPQLNIALHGETAGATDGPRDWVASYFPLADDPGKSSAVGCVVVDVTEQMRGEEKLRESEEKFRQLAENINKVFWVVERDSGRMVYVSAAYEKIWGRSCHSLYERPLSFLDAIHPEDRPRIEASIKRTDGGGQHEEEYRILRPDGTMRWIHDRGFAVRNAQGEFYRRAGLAEDITDRRLLQVQLLQSQKMEAIGQLAGGVAHDFNNILAAILMHLGLLQQSPQLTMAMKETLTEVEGETMRAANLTRQLLLFGRRQAAHMGVLDINGLINELLKMLRRLLGENIDTVFQGGDGYISVWADPSMLEQVVMNLCINARDAMPRGGRLTITTSVAHFSRPPTRRNSNLQPGDFACLTVTDTGSGMEPAILERIFEPFFTTKGVGKGSGLGLATVYGIIKQHDGWVEVDSVVGKGSSFRIYLPVRTGDPIPRPRADDKEIRGGSETILLVEDDLNVRRLAAVCLRKLGYAVLEAASGTEALKVWELHGAKIELLLTDMVMPDELTGRDLARRFKQEKASLKVVISSGYSADLADYLPADDEPTARLPKPYSNTVLAQTVRHCLDGSRAAVAMNEEHSPSTK